MSPFLRNLLAVVAGLFVGGIVNMGLIMLGPSIVPVDPAINPEDMESLQENIHLLTTGNYIMTFLAHAIGTLAGAYAAARLAISNNRSIALGIGAFFLIGGILMAMQLAAPMGFEIFDLVAAYLPMGFLGWKLAGSRGN